MAIYHLSAAIGRRSNGQSAASAAAYILREGHYRDRDPVVYTASGNLTDWAASPSDYWAAADRGERANGRLYRSIEFALPRELTRARQIVLAERFTQHLTDGEHLPHTMAIHDHDDNPHVHLMVSERGLDGIPRTAEMWFRRYNRTDPSRGGARKTETLARKQWLLQAREDWADLVNNALAEAGHLERVDHRSLVDQGIDRTPGIHLGPHIRAMERRGIRTNKGDEIRADVLDSTEIEALMGQMRVLTAPPAPTPMPSPTGSGSDRLAAWRKREAEREAAKEAARVAAKEAAHATQQPQTSKAALDAMRAAEEAESARERTEWMAQMERDRAKEEARQAAREPGEVPADDHSMPDYDPGDDMDQAPAPSPGSPRPRD